MGKQLELVPDERLNARRWVAHAQLSDCGLYRYTLERTWDERLPRVCFVALNPSTAAGAGVEDQTSGKFAGFAERFGAGGYVAVNMFALRSTDPLGLLAAADPVGPGNNDVIARETARARMVLVAWGAPSEAPLRKLLADRVRNVLGILKNRQLYCLGTTKDGSPRHPLYLSYECRPVPWTLKGA